MNNARIAKLMAMGVTMTTFMSPVVAHADVVISEDQSLHSQKTSSGSSVTLVDGVSNDLSNPGGADVSKGPKITVKQDKFLLEKGANFDLVKALGLSVVDSKDGDITDEFKFKPVDTSVAKSFTRSIKAENSAHEVSTKTIVFRIVDIVDSIEIESVEALQTMDLSKVISGDTQGLTVKLGAIKDGSFIAKISDGTNTLEKEIKYNVKQGNTGKPSDSEQKPQEQTQTPNPDNGTNIGSDSTTSTQTPNPGEDSSTTTDGTTTSGETTSNPEALPQTGVASTTAGIAAGLAAISGFILKKKDN